MKKGIFFILWITSHIQTRASNTEEKIQTIQQCIEHIQQSNKILKNLNDKKEAKLTNYDLVLAIHQFGPDTIPYMPSVSTSKDIIDIAKLSQNSKYLYTILLNKITEFKEARFPQNIIFDSLQIFLAQKPVDPKLLKQIHKWSMFHGPTAERLHHIIAKFKENIDHLLLTHTHSSGNGSKEDLC